MNASDGHHPGRNDPCHCGSGRKYKHCCLDKDQEAARAANAATPEPAASNPKPAAPAAPKHKTQQPWKRSAANTRGFHRISTPRKVGGG